MPRKAMTETQKAQAQENMAKARAARASKDNVLLETITALNDRLSRQEETIQALYHKLEEDGTIRRHGSPQSSEDRMSEYEQYEDGGIMRGSRVYDLRHPRNPESGLQPNDYVRPRDTWVGAVATRQGLGLKADEPLPMGVVRRYMCTRPNGQRKYHVWIKGVGLDGFDEKDLELCRSV